MHDALPLASVVPKQEIPSKVNWMLAPTTATAGVTETSLSEPTSVTGLPTITLVGLRFSVRKLVCCPGVQVITRPDWT